MTTRIGYARSDTVSSNVITRQVRAIRERSRTVHEAVFCTDGTYLSEVFVDMGVLGSVPLEERDAGSNLLAYCEANPQETTSPGVVIVQHFDRLSQQNPSKLHKIWSRLANLGWVTIDADGRGLNREALERGCPDVLNETRRQLGFEPKDFGRSIR